MTDSDNLKNKHCKPCEEKSGGLSDVEAKHLSEELNTWTMIDDRYIEKTLKFKDFMEALEFVNKVGAIAEAEGHHPDIKIHDWNKVTITLTTHSIKSLSENDFIVAAKIDGI